jgi:hypothetical protein
MFLQRSDELDAETTEGLVARGHEKIDWIESKYELSTQQPNEVTAGAAPMRRI